MVEVEEVRLDVGDGDPDGAQAAAATVGAPPADLSEADVDNEADETDPAAERRRRALAITGIALLAGLIGMVAGMLIQSPADRAASQEAPPPSLIVVPVERKALSAELVLNGQVGYDEPTAIVLAGPVGIDTDEKAVLTAAPELGAEVAEGETLFEVTNRPVFVLQGELPMYRTITNGATGPDVLELEGALKRLGFDPGTVDEVADDATMQALTEMYKKAGFDPPAATPAERDALQTAEAAVVSAQSELNAANTALGEAKQGPSASEKLQLQQAAEEAQAAVPQAEAAVAATAVEQDAAVRTAQAELSAANALVGQLQSQLDQARAGAINPTTGSPYSGAEVNDLAASLGEAQVAATAAAGNVQAAESARTTAINQANAAVTSARYQSELARLQRDEGVAAADTSGAAGQVAAAQESLARANTELGVARAAAGTRLPAGEVIFVPALPAKLAEFYLNPGAEVSGQIGSIVSSDTTVTAAISRTDTQKVKVGDEVTIEVREADTTMQGTVLSVGEPPVQNTTSQDEYGGYSGGQDNSDGRLQVVVEPADPAVLSEYIDWSARVVISVESTDGDELVVPLAALTVGPDGQDRVEVQRADASDGRDAETEMVPVRVGLTANGLAAVTPVDGTLAEGDQVVIGVEYPDRVLEGAGTDSGDGGSDGEGGDGGGDGGGGDGGGDGGDGSGSDGGGEASPLEEYFGWTDDPVAAREEQLASEERVAACMTEQGFEYQPVDYLSDSAFGGDIAAYDSGQHGYGVVYGYETFETGDEAEADLGFEDPNMEYVNSLSPTDQEAYYRALWGEDNFDTTESSEPPALEDQGCYGKAQAEAGGPTEDEYARLDELLTQAQDAPEIQKAKRAWADCMAGPAEAAGVEVPDDPENMYGAVEKWFIVKRGGEIVEFDSEQEMNSFLEDNSSGSEVVYSEEDGSGFTTTGELKELSASEIEESRSIELELYAADQQCQADSGYLEAANAAEAQVVDTLKSEFPNSDDG